jgi:hypothetical protein
MDDSDRTASLMTPAKLAQVQPKAASSPAAWLSQMAADAGHAHVRRLVELRQQLQVQSLQRDVSPLVAELTRLAKALPEFDLRLLKPRGWWERLSGKGRSAGAEFVSQFDRIDEVTRALAAQVQAVQRKQQEQAGSGERTLVEVEVEFRALDKIMDQGARWLQDMRNQIKTREAAPTDAAGQQQIREDTARCEVLVERLKALRGVSAAAQQSHQQAHGAVARRAALLQTMQQALASDVKAWRTRMSNLASGATAETARTTSLDGAQETHRELQLCVKQVLADCGQLQAQEKALAESLGALGMQLDVVA